MSTGERDPRADDYAIVVGIEHYPYMTPEKSRRIEGVTSDAQRVACWLCEEDGGGLPPENCKLIVSCPDPPTPLQDQIDEIFIQIFKQIPSGEQGRRLYFYFSGHGLANSSSVDDAVLCLTKWSAQFGRHDSMSHGEYKTELTNLGHFRQLVFWFDCCRVRGYSALGRGPRFGVTSPSERASAVRYFVAFASDYLAPSWQVEGQGIFTEVLLAGLRGGTSKARTGRVSAADLKNYLDLEIPRVANDKFLAQTPNISNGFPDQQEFDFCRPNGRHPGGAEALPLAQKWRVRIEFSPARINEVVLETPNCDPVRRGHPADGPWELELDRVTHVLQDVTTQDHLLLRPHPGKEGIHVFSF